MDRIARVNERERRLAFEASAVQLGITPAVVEKDFWVCDTLEHLFHRCFLSDILTFKGSTSLSKAFNLILRFVSPRELSVLDRALDDMGLLARVVEFKEKFYRTPWARLSGARPGSLRMVPAKFRLAELEDDYQSMRPMLFGDYPEFKTVVGYMYELEDRINAGK